MTQSRVIKCDLRPERASLSSEMTFALRVVLEEFGLSEGLDWSIIKSYFESQISSFDEIQAVKSCKLGLAYVFSEFTGQELPCLRSECVYPLNRIVRKRVRRYVSRSHTEKGQKSPGPSGLRLLFSILQMKNLLRYQIPDSFVEATFEKHKKTLSSVPDDLSNEMINHITVVGRQFGEGLTIDLGRFSVAPTSAYLGAPRSRGGCRSYLYKRLVDEDHTRRCPHLHSEVVPGRFYCYENFPSRKVQAEAVLEPLKCRVITKGDPMLWILKSVQTSLTEHLWDFPVFELTHGKPISDFCPSWSAKKGHLFVSGDYSAATDGLHPKVPYLLMREILNHCTFIGASAEVLPALKALVLQEVGPHLVSYPSKSRVTPFEQSTGQLMGSLLSFPLLCLANFVTYRVSQGIERLRSRRLKACLVSDGDFVFPPAYQRSDVRYSLSQKVTYKIREYYCDGVLVDRDLPTSDYPLTLFGAYVEKVNRIFPKLQTRSRVRINGDDIVFHTTPDRIETWKKVASQLGLELSVGKNYVSRSWFTVNSKFVVQGTLQPVAKFRALLPLGDSFGNIIPLGERYVTWIESSKGVHRERKKQLFVRFNKNQLRRDPRSLDVPCELGGLGDVLPENYVPCKWDAACLAYSRRAIFWRKSRIEKLTERFSDSVLVSILESDSVVSPFLNQYDKKAHCLEKGIQEHLDLSSEEVVRVAHGELTKCILKRFIKKELVGKLPSFWNLYERLGKYPRRLLYVPKKMAVSVIARSQALLTSDSAVRPFTVAWYDTMVSSGFCDWFVPGYTFTRRLISEVRITGRVPSLRFWINSGEMALRGFNQTLRRGNRLFRGLAPVLEELDRTPDDDSDSDLDPQTALETEAVDALRSLQSFDFESSNYDSSFLPAPSERGELELGSS